MSGSRLRATQSSAAAGGSPAPHWFRRWPFITAGFRLIKLDLLCTCPRHGPYPPSLPSSRFVEWFPQRCHNLQNALFFIVSLPKANYNNYTLILGFAPSLYRLGLERSSVSPYTKLVSIHSDKYKHQIRFCYGLGRKQRRLPEPSNTTYEVGRKERAEIRQINN